ncbi:unnamed protein product [Brassica rapa]|uniref:Uncharacterized protein n=2 Tax=Brassica TaxID=3705 RepID=A0A3P6ARB0_BRACM|nr:unnamed protein product [Brassica napus]CAG7893040.1 unnamed protein product [Brassica rapa]CDY12687.1 BnaA02g13550D [Brassica napus]VDC87870.1 unnamed protein product [Brassica rapa]
MLSCTQLMIGIFIRVINTASFVTDGERLTLAVWFSQDSSHDEDSNLVSRHASEQLMGSIQIAKGGELLTRKFTNILHALQVVQFHHWKVSELKASRVENDPVDELAAMSQPQLETINPLKSVFMLQ